VLKTENVLMWPKEYILLLRGLLEQNGAFILDALEAWPNCNESVDDQDVCSISLPPIYYILWQKPAEPFEDLYCQHISDFDEKSQQYIESVFTELKQQLESDEAITILLLQRLANYCDFQSQMSIESKLSIVSLAQQKRFFNVLKMLLESGLKLSTSDVMSLLEHSELHSLILPFLETNLIDKQAVVDLLMKQLLQGEDRFEFLVKLDDETSGSELLDKALLQQLKYDSAKQSICKRFIEQGAKGIISDNNGKTSLIWAVKQGFIDVLEALSTDDLIAQVDNDGNTVLHHAIEAKNELAIRFLLNKNIDFAIQNNLGFTAYGFAVELGHKKIVALLENEFGIKELSEVNKFKRINLVHSLHALIGFLLPIQLFFFFDPKFDSKSELSFLLALSSMLIMFFAMNLKRCSLYPDIKHTWSLSFLRALSPISLLSQLLLLLVVVIAALT